MDPIFKVKLENKMLKHNSEGPLGTLLQTSGEFPDLVHLITLSLSSDWQIAEIVDLLELSHRFKQDFWSAARVTFSQAFS